jgi:Prolyl oligopeptidase, N-terminal beta-propeller domain
MVAYAEDTKGDEIYEVHVIDAESGKPVEQPMTGITSDVEWANDEYIVYVTMDDILRPDKACTISILFSFMILVQIMFKSLPLRCGCISLILTNQAIHASTMKKMRNLVSASPSPQASSSCL